MSSQELATVADRRTAPVTAIQPVSQTLEQLLDPSRGLTPELERALSGQSFYELGMRPEDLEIKLLQMGIIRHVFKIIDRRIEDGLRDDNAPVIRDLLEKIGSTLRGILVQAEEVKRTRAKEMRDELRWYKRQPGLRKATEKADKDAFEIGGARVEIDNLVDGLRKKLRASFTVNAEQDKLVYIAVRLKPLLENLIKSIEVFASRGNQNHRRTQRVELCDTMRQLEISVNLMHDIGDVQGNDWRLAEIVRLHRCYKGRDLAVVDLYDISKIETLARGLVEDFETVIRDYQTARMAEFRRGIGA